VKLDEWSTTRGGKTFVPGAGGCEGDVADQANSDAEAELQIRLHQTDGPLLRAIEEALVRVKQGTYGVCVAGLCPNCHRRAQYSLDAAGYNRKLAEMVFQREK